MIQMLSGHDWQVSEFFPYEIAPHYGHIKEIAKGKLFGAAFIPATVPGDVQSDALDAGIIKDINVGFNARLAEWTSQRDWLYVKRFTREKGDFSKIKLCFDGVDDLSEIYLNGEFLGSHEIPWIPFEFDITDKLLEGENSLIVVLNSVRDTPDQCGRCTDVRHLKPRFAYFWDWCTRLVPLGIWRDVYVKYIKNADITDLHVTQKTDYHNRRATLSATLSAELISDEVDVEFTLTSPMGEKTEKTVRTNGGIACVDFDIEKAELWYPNGLGGQPLYDVVARLGNGDGERRVRIGLRHIVWERTAGAGEDALPYQPYINGLRVYLQGYNFTPIRQLYGRVHSDVYKKRLDLVKNVGANYLRIWGGGLLEREELYNLCDEYGILVMQELFQSSASVNNHPPRDEAYIDMLCRATESAVIQKRNHPSLICWCGGNELCFRGDYMDADGNIIKEGVEGNEGYTYDVDGMDWVPLSPNYPTLKRMREVVKRLDGERHWLHTSGSGPITQNAFLRYVGKMHDVHGPWEIGGPKEHYTLYNRLDMMIHHEFGIPGSASVQALEHMVGCEKYLWPIDENNPMMNYKGRMWAGVYNQIKPFFGELENHIEYSIASRFIQWEEIRYALEAHRRLGARCAGACLWHYGEPWPNMNDNCTVDAYDQPKPAYYGEKSAFSPIHIAAYYDSIMHEGDISCEIAVFNNTETPLSADATVTLYTLTGEPVGQESQRVNLGAYAENALAFAPKFSDICDGTYILKLELFGTDGQLIDSGYSVHSSGKKLPYRELLGYKTEVKYELSGNTVILENVGSYAAIALNLECGLDEDLMFSDGAILLLPGEKRAVEITSSSGKDRVGSLYISAFGVDYKKIK